MYLCACHASTVMLFVIVVACNILGLNESLSCLDSLISRTVDFRVVLRLDYEQVINLSDDLLHRHRTTADGDMDLKKKKEKEDKKKKIKVKEAEDSGNEGVGEWEKVGAAYAVSDFQLYLL